MATIRTCENCGTSSDATYCSACGQSMTVKLLTVGEMLTESLDIFFNLDSRVWRTLLPLALEPGKLTNEFIAGRRAAYLPPFRTYLVFSLIFFVFIAVPDFSEPNLGADGEAGRAVAQTTLAHRTFDDASRDLRDRAAAAPGDSPGPAAATPDSQEEIDPDPNGWSIDFSRGTRFDPGGDCANIPWSALLGEWLGGRALRGCERSMADGFRSLGEAFVDNIPLMMFVCAPLVAAFMKLLYCFRRRKYVEHLTFLLHTHSFFFVFAIFLALTGGLVALVPAAGGLVSLLQVAAWVYFLVYVFVAMRRVYGQSRWLTGIKYAVLAPIYLTCLIVTMTIGFVLAFLSL